MLEAKDHSFVYTCVLHGAAPRCAGCGKQGHQTGEHPVGQHHQAAHQNLRLWLLKGGALPLHLTYALMHTLTYRIMENACTRPCTSLLKLDQQLQDDHACWTCTYHPLQGRWRSALQKAA